jgi:hypothetical protein
MMIRDRTFCARLALVAWLSLSGCGGPDPLEGIWAAEARPCAVEWAFDSGTVKAQKFCILQSGPVGIQVREGRYTLSDARVTVQLLRSSCPSDGGSDETLEARVDRDTLTLTAPGRSSSTFSRRKETTAVQGASVFGCFSGTTFTRNAVRDL